ncbi:hypothetical protein ACLB2K_013992 [Fragaria x ananassa]
MVEIIDDLVDPGTQVEKELFQSGDTSLPQTGNAALEILKRDFHSFHTGQTVTQLALRIEGIESRGAQRPLFSSYGHRPSPFTPRVQMDKRPPGTKPFKMDKYKGTGDPHLHLETFFSLCSSSGYNDAIACHAFQETLSDEALSWFLNLPPNSIDNFDQLSERFLNRFILHTNIYRNVDVMFHIKQKVGVAFGPFGSVRGQNRKLN